MFRKQPGVSSHSAVSSSPIDLTASSPPSAKKQKTAHPPPPTFPTPSRPRGPRQTQLTAFLATPPPVKKFTPTKSIGKKRAKNTSILKFFKPVADGDGKGGKKDGKSDELFISHGGYGLDVSDPEDADESDDEELGLDALIAREAMKAGPPPEPMELEQEVASEPVSTVNDDVPTESTTAPITPIAKTKYAAPKFDPSALKLNLSSSMLFGKAPAPMSATKTTATTPTDSGDDTLATATNDVAEEATTTTTPSVMKELASVPSKAATFESTDTTTKVEHTVATKTVPANARDIVTTKAGFRGLLWGRKPQETEVLDDIEDFTQTQTQRFKKRQREPEDHIQGTFESMSVNSDHDVEDAGENEDDNEDEPNQGSDASDEEEDAEEDTMGFEQWEATQTTFDFDPAARAVERGFWQDTQVIMKPSDVQVEATQLPAAAKCPICGTSFARLSNSDANAHVNRCLDGDPMPPPATPKTSRITYTLPPTSETSNPHAPLKFQTSNKQASAFTKIMSNNTKEHAWASAAKTEAESKGKRAIERTCPFYKILFNGPITVDAFRYGKIPGCNAYFLSHFHSDHYVGLSSTWQHGPIYCSRVTANLVRSRLKVDPQWVVELPWEEWLEVPGVDGVRVRGLDANHCPGSMLFLFENLKGKKPIRVLHCGDFRAEPKHLDHPLLRPGKNRTQKIDTVYLDTTYLDPKYAFPTQKNVIDACAEMCVLLDSDQVPDMKDSGSLANFVTKATEIKKESEATRSKRRLLIMVGTYSIGKERIATGSYPHLPVLNISLTIPHRHRSCAQLQNLRTTKQALYSPTARRPHPHTPPNL